MHCRNIFAPLYCSLAIATAAWTGALTAQEPTSAEQDRPSSPPAETQSEAKSNQQRQAKLRGSVTPERSWWDLQHYDLAVEFLPKTKRIRGSNKISFIAVQAGQKMQIDLQPPLQIDSVKHGQQDLKFEREGNVYWVALDKELSPGAKAMIDVHYSGEPTVAARPPWDGGVTWGTDKNGNPHIVTTCQGIGASIWWPNKDHGADEPDRGMDIRITVPEKLTAVSNGRLQGTTAGTEPGTKTFHWVVTNPINNYCVNANIGNYVNFSDTYAGKFGELDLDYWVLVHQKEKAIKHFKEVPRTIEAFEHWFGKYPFYEDSFKIVAVPYPGMEHQSSVTYGNNFSNGYRGRDLSGTGVGLKFDFIIVHESGHEWFGNNISMQDVADMWIHEGFTNYGENLFVEYHFSEKEAQDYVIGCRKLVKNDEPIIGGYGVHREGSGDMYYKAGNMLHTLRHIFGNDEAWLAILRGLNEDFWHQTVTTVQIESYINEKTGIDFSKLFDQYLRDTRIPNLNYRVDQDRLVYWFSDIVDGFSFPTKIAINGEEKVLTPTGEEQTLELDAEIVSVDLNRNFYFNFTKHEK